MSGMSDLAIEAEELFSADNFWAEWSRIEDHGMIMYAFAGLRWSWTSDLHYENTHRTVTEPYYLGGDGVRGSSPIFCSECAANFAIATGLEEISTNTLANPDDKYSVFVTKHPVSIETGDSVMNCPCGNALFSLVDIETIMNAAQRDEITLGQALDLIYLNGHFDRSERGLEVEYVQPLFKSGWYK